MYSQLYSTLGVTARDFSSAVSGFCQVFIIVTRAKSVFLAASPHARKTSGTQAKSADVGTENKGAYRKSELAGWLVFAKTK